MSGVDGWGWMGWMGWMRMDEDGWGWMGTDGMDEDGGGWMRMDGRTTSQQRADVRWACTRV